jgi:NAD(P)-dependent dehydrogenase (short-subunit alcohol dehydrogenase family)
MTPICVVTGCSSGLGKHLAEAVLALGERVVATARKPKTLESIKQKYTPEQLLVLPLDVTDSAAIDSVFGELAQQWGRLDVLVNNAGYGLMGEVEGTDDAAARAQIEVLFWGAVNMSKKAVAFFREMNPEGLGGRILQVSSIGGFIGFPGKAFYHAGKFGK